MLKSSIYALIFVLNPYRQNPLQAREESVFELPNFSIAATKPQLFLSAYLINSWLTSSCDHNKFHHSSLMDDVFALGSDVKAKRFPVLEVVLSNSEVKICDTEAATSATATMTSLQMLLLTEGVYKSP